VRNVWQIWGLLHACKIALKALWQQPIQQHKEAK